MDRLGIEQLCVFGMPPVAFVNLAADLGCRYISMTLTSTHSIPLGYQSWSLEASSLRRDMMMAMRDRGVSISLGDGFVVFPDQDIRLRKRDLELLRELGVPCINTLTYDPDLSRSFDQLAALAEMADAVGLECVLEFSPNTKTPSLDLALQAVRHVGRPTFRLMIDTMHFARLGGTAADLAALDPNLIGYIQLCDVPRVSRFATYIEEARFERMVPGDGELPLLDLLTALPRHLVVGLEIPLRAAALAGVGAHERVGACVAAARKLLARADSQ